MTGIGFRREEDSPPVEHRAGSQRPAGLESHDQHPHRVMEIRFAVVAFLGLPPGWRPLAAVLDDETCDLTLTVEVP